MTRWVVDASVALKWCLPSGEEEFVPQAERLLDSYDRGKSQFLVPDLFWIELGERLMEGCLEAKNRSTLGAEGLLQGVGPQHSNRCYI